jgi:hypothetical protein
MYGRDLVGKLSQSLFSFALFWFFFFFPFSFLPAVIFLFLRMVSVGL